VREAHQIQYANVSGICGTPRIISGVYKADTEKFEVQLTEQEWSKFKRRKRKGGNQSARFMYKTLARIWLEITNIRVERVQDIVADEYSWDVFHEGICQICEDEGVRYDSDPLGEPPQYCGGNGGIGCFADYKALFIELWDSLNSKRGYGWDKNPWVWVIEFKNSKDAINGKEN